MTARRWDHLYERGSVADALIYATLLWPTFVERAGMIFLEEEFDVQPDLADLDTTLGRFGGDKTAVEMAYNLIEVPILFAAAMDADDEDLVTLAVSLRDSWRAKLAQDFPDREFVVEVLGGDVDDPTVRFYRVR